MWTRIQNIRSFILNYRMTLEPFLSGLWILCSKLNFLYLQRIILKNFAALSSATQHKKTSMYILKALRQKYIQQSCINGNVHFKFRQRISPPNVYKLENSLWNPIHNFFHRPRLNLVRNLHYRLFVVYMNDVSQAVVIKQCVLQSSPFSHSKPKTVLNEVFDFQAFKFEQFLRKP